MRNRLAVTQRRSLISLHVLTSAGWFGAAFCFLVLSITAASAKDGGILQAAYSSIFLLDKAVMRPLAVSTVVTGVLLSALTQWGLFKFPWVIAKEVLTVLSIGMGVVVMSRVPEAVMSMISTEGLSALQNPAYQANLSMLLILIVFQILSLSAMVVISVFKPGHQRGEQRQTAARRFADGEKEIALH